ncbi:MAG: hypothetical protein HQ575_00975 [Candidatus Omnitrophica bacterium]|nr:hypothetical protein [Candidatus Omnitrophota bacterium]
MFWGLLALTSVIWIIAIFYIIKGWEGSRIAIESQVPVEIKVEDTEKAAPVSDIEIPIEAPSPPPPSATPYAPKTQDPENFYKEFSKANVVEFPAEYIDGDRVRGPMGGIISVCEFARNCYKEIGFRCTDLIIRKNVNDHPYRLNIFDLIFDHYSSTEEAFIKLFGNLKEEFAEDIRLIGNHSDMAHDGKKALIGKTEGLPEFVVYDERELFFVTVKAKGEALKAQEEAFLREFVIEKKLFKARIFRVTERLKKMYVPPKTDEEKRPLAREVFGIYEKDAEKKIAKKSFTAEEIQFLEENKDAFTNEELAEKLGRTVDSVTHKLSRLGIARETYDWTKDKDKFLRNNISNLTYKEISEKLGTTIPSVRARCRKLDIKK